MKILYRPNFKKSLKNFSTSIKNKFEKQAVYLITNIRHPSLHAKKYEESTGTWQARVL
jgi:mRNA-degrading endonuclease RelE of RelBE toxin-antitoxin system